MTDVLQADGPGGAKPLPLVYLAMVCVLLGTIATLWGYSYGTGNQTEYLVMARRALDRSFLTNDFYTNATASFGPRSYFIHLITALASFASLPAVFLSLALLANIAIALVTALAARDLFRGSTVAAVMAAAMTLSLDTLQLGAAATIASPGLLQGTLAAPLALLSIWEGLKGRLLPCGLFAGLASLIHSVVGIQTGAVVLGASTLAALIEPRTEDRKRSRLLLENGLGWLLFLTCGACSLVPYLRLDHIPAPQFVAILAVFRAPHHYLPSSFSKWHYIRAVCFFVATLLSWSMAVGSLPRGKQLWHTVVGILALVLFACLGGYLFVEIIPTHLWTAGQMFRLLFVVKWLGFLGVAGLIGRLLRDPMESQGQMRGISLLAGVLTAETMLLTLILSAPASFMRRKLVEPLSGLGGLALLLALFAYAVQVLQTNVLYCILAIVGLSALAVNTAVRRIATPGLLTAVIAVGLLFGDRVLPERVRLPKPVFSLSGFVGQEAELGRALRAKTPTDAVILAPPSAGMLRLLGERALVVDFKLFPFGDKGMVSWYQRIVDCYGAVSGGGFLAAQEMETRYRSIDDARLRLVAHKYGASFAVLYRETMTVFPAVAETETLKLVGPIS